MPVAAVSRKRVARVITIRCSSTGSGAIYSVETLCDHKLNQETAAGWCDALAFLDDRSKSLLSRNEASLLLNFCEFRLPWFGMRRWSPHGKCCANDTPKAGMIFHFLQTLLAIAAGLWFRTLSLTLPS